MASLGGRSATESAHEHPKRRGSGESQETPIDGRIGSTPEDRQQKDCGTAIFQTSTADQKTFPSSTLAPFVRADGENGKVASGNSSAATAKTNLPWSSSRRIDRKESS